MLEVDTPKHVLLSSIKAVTSGFANSRGVQ
jgi:hypothetical protein